MALDGKWNEGLSPTMPLAEAARLILTARLETLLRWWAQAEQAVKETEPIHNLRVASRRLAAAFQSFGDLIPRRVGRTLRRQSRRLRRRSGEVRDRDVFLIQIAKWRAGRGPVEHPGCDFLTGIWTHWRHEAIQRLAPELHRHERFAEAAAALQLRGGRKKSFRNCAADIMADAVAEFEASIALDAGSADQLHTVRIHAKRLRYTIETFSVCFPPGQAIGAYEQLEELQDLLGAAHDAAVNAVRVQHELDCVADERYRPGITAWLDALQALEARAPARFSQWRSQWLEIAPALQLDA